MPPISRRRRATASAPGSTFPASWLLVDVGGAPCPCPGHCRRTIGAGSRGRVRRPELAQVTQRVESGRECVDHRAIAHLRAADVPHAPQARPGTHRAASAPFAAASAGGRKEDGEKHPRPSSHGLAELATDRAKELGQVSEGQPIEPPASTRAAPARVLPVSPSPDFASRALRSASAAIRIAQHSTDDPSGFAASADGGVLGRGREPQEAAEWRSGRAC